MDNPNHPGSLDKHKVWLVDEITGTANWCHHVAGLFPDDTRSLRCCDALKALADAIEALPVTHPLFGKLAQISSTDPLTHERWLDEVRLEFSSIGYLTNDSAPHAIEKLIAITDASLCDTRNAGKLH
jgi:hypothetical protein